jgi:hypothetical protein
MRKESLKEKSAKERLSEGSIDLSVDMLQGGKPPARPAGMILNKNIVKKIR